MIDPLYQKEILRLAASAFGSGRLEAATASADIRNPLCGDRITVDLIISDGKIEILGHTTRACVLCQASASLMAEVLPGQPPEAFHHAALSVRAFLDGGDEDTLPPPFARFSVFAPVKPHGSRHSCVLLPFDAVTAALKQLESVES